MYRHGTGPTGAFERHMSSNTGRVCFAASLFVSLVGMQIGMVMVAARYSTNGTPEHGNFRELAAVETRTCPNFDGGPPAKALPSLQACYFYTDNSCCVIGHDNDVDTAIKTILPESCAGNYNVLSEYMCMGCAADITKYITYYNDDKSRFTEASVTAGKRTAAGELTHATTALAKVQGKIGEIRLCESFARNLFYTDGVAATAINAYDDCAVKHTGSAHLSSIAFAMQDIDYVDASAVPKVVKDFTTDIKRSQELNFLSTVRPPTFSANDFELSWYHTDKDSCYGAASGTTIGSMAAAVVALVAYTLV